jgi:hypothetical protein
MKLGLKPSQMETLFQNYSMQFTLDILDSIAAQIVDFFEIFNDWHCGLNQLRKFN